MTHDEVRSILVQRGLRPYGVQRRKDGSVRVSCESSPPDRRVQLDVWGDATAVVRTKLWDPHAHRMQSRKHSMGLDEAIELAVQHISGGTT